MAKPKILLLGKIEHAFDTWASLTAHADVITPRATNRAEFIAECRAGALDGVVVAYRTFDSIAVTGAVDAELVACLPDSLRFLCHNGAGYDSIDVLACTQRGRAASAGGDGGGGGGEGGGPDPGPILVSNAPTAVDDATADIGIWLMLGALRELNQSLVNLRRGEWRGSSSSSGNGGGVAGGEGQVVKRSPLPPLGHDPEGKTLGILGMGGIGRNMARKCALAFGMRVLYHNRTRLDAEAERESGGAEYCSFEELLRESDVLSLNLPLNPSTRHTISTAQFAQMKPGVVLVNTARGAVVDEAALVAALASGRVASAGLDVYEDEPAVHPALLADERVLLVPHMGTWTVETCTKMEEWTMGNVAAALRGGRLRSIVPEQRHLQA